MIGGYQDDNEETIHLQKTIEKNDVHELICILNSLTITRVCLTFNRNEPFVFSKELLGMFEIN